MTMRLARRLRAAAANEEGATAVEYGLMVALIAMAIFGGVYLLGPALSDIFNTVANSLS
jgi:pilus assembly protein Flp/PilA